MYERSVFNATTYVQERLRSSYDNTKNAVKSETMKRMEIFISESCSKDFSSFDSSNDSTRMNDIIIKIRCFEIFAMQNLIVTDQILQIACNEPKLAHVRKRMFLIKT